MASSDPRDPIFGIPYTGTPKQQGNAKTGKKTVLDMYRLATVTITVSTSDGNRTPNGNLYHE